jgi:2-polyprenyl-3-methyl-5-hydroxy-6-metoxy-1,4-benzoquinol methylase
MLGDLNAGLYGHAPTDAPNSPKRLPGRHRRELAFMRRYQGEGGLLDVGCGTGRFLIAARNRGWRVAGVDLSEANALAAQGVGLDVRGTTLSGAGFTAASFDAARLNSVIEHLPEPLELLSDIARVVRPGGVLSLSTPNVTSTSARLLGADWHQLGREGNAHVVFFSRTTLTRALEETGFRPIKWKTTGLRLRPRARDTILARRAAQVLQPFVGLAGKGSRLHVFAERTSTPQP